MGSGSKYSQYSHNHCVMQIACLSMLAVKLTNFLKLPGIPCNFVIVIFLMQFPHCLVITVYDSCCYIGVTRSRRIESDRDYQKSKERVQELKVLCKGKNCILQSSSILKRLTLTRLPPFTSQIVTSKILTQVPFFCVDHHFLYSFSFLPRAWILPGIKTSSSNLVRVAGRPISFHRPNPWGW